VFQASTAAGYKCPGQLKSGTCPTSGVLGCCVSTNVTTIYSTTITGVGGTCYYSASTVAGSQAGCVAVQDPDAGITSVWQTSTPTNLP
jgi:hypothetical protein